MIPSSNSTNQYAGLRLLVVEVIVIALFAALSESRQDVHEHSDASTTALNSASELTRSTPLPNHYVLKETLDDVSSTPRAMMLEHNGQRVLNVEWPTFVKVIDLTSSSAASSNQKAAPRLVFMTQDDIASTKRAVNRLNVLALPPEAPKYLLKDAETWNAPKYAMGDQIDVEDINLGVNQEPDDSTVDLQYPTVMLMCDGKKYSASADAMRRTASADELSMYKKVLPLGVSSHAKEVPSLTPMVISRMIEFLYCGDSEHAKLLLDITYPKAQHIAVQLPFKYYFDANSREIGSSQQRLLSKEEIWRTLVNYVRENSAYLSTLKELNPELF